MSICIDEEFNWQFFASSILIDFFFRRSLLQFNGFKLLIFTNQWKYNVFLRFRKEDTRYKFTDYLYTTLGQKWSNSVFGRNNLCFATAKFFFLRSSQLKSNINKSHSLTFLPHFQFPKFPVQKSSLLSQKSVHFVG